MDIKKQLDISSVRWKKILIPLGIFIGLSFIGDLLKEYPAFFIIISILLVFIYLSPKLNNAGKICLMICGGLFLMNTLQGFPTPNALIIFIFFASLIGVIAFRNKKSDK